MKANWTNTLLGLFLLAFAGSGGLSCSKQVARQSVDTNTNWLRMCDRDSECGASLECVCGVCTVSCEASSACREFENGACTPTRSCNEASAVCASTEGFEALSLSPSSAADPAGEGSSILCIRSVEDYVVRGSCAGVDIDCDTASKTRSGDTYFEDACGCGCTAAQGFGGAGSGGSGNGAGGSGGESSPSGGTGSSDGRGGSSTSPGGRGSGGTSSVGGTVHSQPGGNGTGGTPATGGFNSATGAGGAAPTGFDDSFFYDPLCNIPPRDFDPRGVECDDALRDYSKGSKSQCGRNDLGANLVLNGGFNDDCGCGCWDASPDTCEDEARIYVSRDRDGECNNRILACGALDSFIDVCGCGCWKAFEPESLADGYLPFEVGQCPAPPAEDEISYDAFDLGEFGCDEGAVIGTGTVAIRSEDEFRNALSACDEDPAPSGLDFSESALILSAIEDSPHVSLRYVVLDDAGSVSFGVTAYQYCGAGETPRGMVAFVVDAEVSSATASTCYLMTCQSLAP